MENMGKGLPKGAGGLAARLATVAVGGGLMIYGAANSLFNVEGGHRAIVFNRLVGIKEQVNQSHSCCPPRAPMSVRLPYN
jgi:hypothetical protein